MITVYQEFHHKYDQHGCWFCGWKRGQRSSFYPRKLEAAHIIGGSGRRKVDRKALVLLCKACHLRVHGSRVVVDGERLGPIGLAEVLWLKRKHDKKYYDRKWLASIWHGDLLPRARRPKTGRHAR